jgi:hypothetical protein
LLSWFATRQRLRLEIPARVLRTNVNGRDVPVVLGGPVVLGTVGGAVVALAALGSGANADGYRIGAALLVVALGLYAAGVWDDRRGDERPRGFRGHLAAARERQLTGGIVKLGSGLVAGVIAGALVEHGWGVAETALLVALGANLINLFDRAPGRAGKVSLAILVPLVIFGLPVWAVTAAGSIAAVVVALPFDLKERAMLGDAGANPPGAVLGMGLALSLPEGWRLVAIALLAALNVASEHWSFSETIARVPVLNALDRLGRS